MSFTENPYAWMILAFHGDKVKWICIGTECEKVSEGMWTTLDKVGDLRESYSKHLETNHVILREDFQHWSEMWILFE